MRKFTAAVLVLALGFTTFVACGDDEEKIEATQAQVDAAKNSVTAINAVKANPGDVNTVANLYSLMANANTLLAAATTSESSSLSRPLEGSESGCVTSSGGTYTYDGCGTVEGTVTVEGDTVKFDLTLSVTGAAGTGTGDYSASVGITLKGEVTVTSESLKGKIDMAVNVEASGTGVPGGATSASATTSVEYDVTIDSSGCPTGGTMKVSASASGTTGGSSGSGSASVTAEFGPACGDVALSVEAAGE
jgi:hypothetical protein